MKLDVALFVWFQVVYCVVTSGFLCYLHILLSGLFAVTASLLLSRFSRSNMQDYRASRIRGWRVPPSKHPSFVALSICHHSWRYLQALKKTKVFVSLTYQTREVMGIVHYKRMHLVLESICRLTRPLFCMWPNLPQAQLSGTVGLENIRAVLACFEVRRDEEGWLVNIDIEIP